MRPSPQKSRPRLAIRPRRQREDSLWLNVAGHALVALSFDQAVCRNSECPSRRPALHGLYIQRNARIPHKRHWAKLAELVG